MSCSKHPLPLWRRNRTAGIFFRAEKASYNGHPPTSRESIIQRAFSPPPLEKASYNRHPLPPREREKYLSNWQSIAQRISIPLLDKGVVQQKTSRNPLLAPYPHQPVNPNNLLNKASYSGYPVSTPGWRSSYSGHPRPSEQVVEHFDSFSSLHFSFSTDLFRECTNLINDTSRCGL